MTHVVSVVKVKDPLDEVEVKHAISSSVDLLGGLSSIVRKDDRVILKPNLEAPRHANTAATTSMVFIERLVELIRLAGARPIVAEGPFMNYDAKTVFTLTGAEELCHGLDVELVNLNDTETVEVRVPGGKAHKKLRIPRIILEADKIVNLPKMKTHHLTSLTCSMKNLKGILPGRDKQLSHVRGLDQAIVDINKVVQSDLIIVDGILAMQGRGPTFGDSIQLGVIIAGTNDLAVDIACSQMMGLDPDDVKHLRIAMQEFSIRPDDVKVVGTPLEEVKTQFNVPHESWTYRFAQRSAHILDRQVYQQFRPEKSIYPLLSGLFGAHPRIDAAKCTVCGICAKSCPVDAIDLPKKKILASKCIDCLICSELCPFQAIQIKSISERKNA
jgi:uncharacterized protein (DUF362 family)/ferredoxin